MKFPLRPLMTLAIAGSLAACAQGIGDRCQLDTDCAGFPDTAFCAVPGGMKAIGGTCQSKATATDGGSPDLTATVTPPDMSVDAAVVTDGATDSSVVLDMVILPDLLPILDGSKAD